MKISLTTVILTFNEEMHIERCIKSVREISEEVYIIDSFSTDRTVEIAESMGAIVVRHEWPGNQAEQLNWGLQNFFIKSAWIMRLDADEYLSAALKDEMQNVLPNLGEDISGIILNYRHYFMGRWIKHGTRYPLPLLRIWRTGVGYIENKWMDERVILKEGGTHKLKSDFIHDDLNDISFFTQKHNVYATREAIDLLNKEYHFMDSEENNKKDHEHFNLYLKNKFYSNSFLFFRCFVYFVYRYFFRLGFLDGKEGLVYHFLQGFWYRFLVDTKIFELKHRFKNDEQAIVAYIKETYKI